MPHQLVAKQGRNTVCEANHKKVSLFCSCSHPTIAWQSSDELVDENFCSKSRVQVSVSKTNANDVFLIQCFTLSVGTLLR